MTLKRSTKVIGNDNSIGRISTIY